MTSLLPPAVEHYLARTDAVKRAAQRVVHVEEIALGFAAVSVWTFAVLPLISG
jgi:hypothetical protein